LRAGIFTGMLGVGFMAHDKLLKEKRGAVMDMAARHGAKNIRVFGSVVRGQAGAE